MKRFRLILLLVLLAAAPLLPGRVLAQADEIQQLLLNVEKLNQLRSILSDMKKGYQVLHTGYNTVKSISEGSFQLHEAFLDGLLAVHPSLPQYHRVAAILQGQQRLVQEYNSAFARFRRQGHFSPEELAYLATVYARLLEQSAWHLEELALVLTAGTLRMQDDERLAAIDRIAAGMADKLAFLRHFNRQTTLLALQRSREQSDIRVLGQLLQPTP
ncbi:hypothetical protein [Pontibacter indicus]|uniref:TerB family tellurite resistance protein n=1 Tax=Pontibacter indicus TaxID=1317125 RepID=A0A1R3XTL5_9BACT|nr:hypothetical protein [Pontibacter indicus]SIT95220.1 hypothetical protein SAMN05444128_3969 [Pontibacter indicus]